MRFRIRWRGKVEEGVILSEIRERLSDGSLSLAHEVDTDRGWISVEELLQGYEVHEAAAAREAEQKRLMEARNSQQLQKEQQALISDYQKALEEERALRIEVEQNLEKAAKQPSGFSSPPSLLPQQSFPSQPPSFYPPPPTGSSRTNSSAAKIHIANNGQNDGPFSSREIRQMLLDGEISTSTLAWKPGMQNWVPLYEMNHDFQNPAPRHLAPPVPKVGLGRFGYFGLSVLIPIIYVLLGFPLSFDDESFALVSLVAFIGSLILTCFRLQNMGYSGFYCLLLFLPLVNVFLGVMCMVAPPGYAQTKKLDTAGIILLTIFLALFALILFGVIVEGL